MWTMHWSRGALAQTGKTAGRAAIFAAAALALGAAATGCVASGRADVVADYPVVEVDTAPVAIETYPAVYYEGSYAYLVDGRWYYRSGGRWVVFRREPRQLMTYRIDHERRQARGGYYSAPPAHPRRHHR